MQLWELRRENLPLTREINLIALVVLKKKLLYEKAPPQIPTLYPLVYTIFDRIGSPFVVYLLQSNLC